MKDLDEILSGGDLRTVRKSNAVVSKINNQQDFDELFNYLFHKDRLIVMRAADAIEKITINNPQYLIKHKENIFELCNTVKTKELKWHLALLLHRLSLDAIEISKAWSILMIWTMDKNNSRIVRVNSLQGLFELLKQRADFAANFRLILPELKKENVPSINSRIRRLEKQISEQNAPGVLSINSNRRHQ